MCLVFVGWLTWCPCFLRNLFYQRMLTNSRWVGLHKPAAEINGYRCLVYQRVYLIGFSSRLDTRSLCEYRQLVRLYVIITRCSFKTGDVSYPTAVFLVHISIVWPVLSVLGGGVRSVFVVNTCFVLVSNCVYDAINGDAEFLSKK